MKSSVAITDASFLKPYLVFLVMLFKWVCHCRLLEYMMADLGSVMSSILGTHCRRRQMLTPKVLSRQTFAVNLICKLTLL